MDEFKAKALQAIEELRTRGWRRGALGWNLGDVISPGFTGTRGRQFAETVADDPEDCKVCALGAAGAAWFGTPRNGYGYDPAAGGSERLDPRYDDFLELLALQAVPGWESQTRPGWEDDEDSHVPRYTSPSDVVAEWNDTPTRTAAEVIDLYQRVADA